MKTWQKILIVVLILLIGGVIYLYFVGRESSQPDPSNQNNPIFPFETSSGDFFDGGGGSDDGDDNRPVVQETPQLWQVSDRPVAGSQWVTKGGSTEIWYAHRENGHLFTSSPDDRQPRRLTNTTIPQVQAALITPDGNYVLYQYLDDDTGQIKTYKGTITLTDTGEMPYEINGTFLPNGISTINLSPNGQEVFFLQPADDRVVGVVHNLTSEENRVVFESTATEWRSVWTASDKLVLFTKPAMNTEGFAYTINTNSGEMQKIGEGRGLVASLSSNKNYTLSSRDVDGQYRGQITASSSPSSTLLSPQTLADKCSWAQERDILLCGIPGNFPANPLKDWYQGRISFTDTLLLLDPVYQDQSNLFSSEQREQGPFDIININTDPTFNFLTFQNKRTEQLWGFEL